VSAATAEESVRIQAGLALLKADYTVCTQEWIGCSFQMTATDRELLQRLVPSLALKARSAAAADDKTCQAAFDGLGSAGGVEAERPAHANPI
jgi:hypothetical protein